MDGTGIGSAFRVCASYYDILHLALCLSFPSSKTDAFVDFPHNNDKMSTGPGEQSGLLGALLKGPQWSLSPPKSPVGLGIQTSNLLIKSSLLDELRRLFRVCCDVTKGKLLKLPKLSACYKITTFCT